MIIPPKVNHSSRLLKGSHCGSTIQPACQGMSGTNLPISISLPDLADWGELHLRSQLLEDSCNWFWSGDNLRVNKSQKKLPNWKLHKLFWSKFFNWRKAFRSSLGSWPSLLGLSAGHLQGTAHSAPEAHLAVQLSSHSQGFWGILSDSKTRTAF